MNTPITASMLYDLVHCPHRPTMDLYGDPTQRDEANAFVQLLWERGSVYEKEVMAGLDMPFTDLSACGAEERERRTAEAMGRGDPLIYAGRISADNLLGDPDLLRRADTGYIAGDIKSGSGEEGPEDDAKPKKHYAVQLGLYTDILERKGSSGGRRAFIWDVHGQEVIYDFTELIGKRDPHTLWDDYQKALAAAAAIVEKTQKTDPAYAAACKMCHWYSACLKRLIASDDLTLIPDLGRSKRDTLRTEIGTIQELAEINLEAFIKGKKTVFPGIGPAVFENLQARAKLLAAGKDGKPYLREPVTLPHSETELFFDIEVDPMRDTCYLHGFIERLHGSNEPERFVYFFADTATESEECKVFAEAIDYIRTMHDAVLYYYSKYERTIYRKLQEKYPDVCTPDEIEAIFDPSRSVDLLYDVVKKATEWPTRDHSIKTLAKYLGFSWRDTHPSGAASIEWFHRYTETGDPEIKKRILDYNEDDCRATRVLLDGIRALG